MSIQPPIIGQNPFQIRPFTISTCEDGHSDPTLFLWLWNPHERYICPNIWCSNDAIQKKHISMTMSLFLKTPPNFRRAPHTINLQPMRSTLCHHIRGFLIPHALIYSLLLCPLVPVNDCDRQHLFLHWEDTTYLQRRITLDCTSIQMKIGSVKWYMNQVTWHLHNEIT